MNKIFCDDCLNVKKTAQTLFLPLLSCGGRDLDAAVTLALDVARLPAQQKKKHRSATRQSSVAEAQMNKTT